jgi:hypothetical protein
MLLLCRPCCRAHTGSVRELLLVPSATPGRTDQVQIVSCGADGWLVATPVSAKLMDSYANLLVGQASKKGPWAAPMLLEALQWHCHKGIVQVGSGNWTELKLGVRCLGCMYSAVSA